jgi:hypothetical protein
MVAFADGDEVLDGREALLDDSGWGTVHSLLSEGIMGEES